MAMNNNSSSNEEPSSAPKPERWYELSLGSTFKDHSSSRRNSAAFDHVGVRRHLYGGVNSSCFRLALQISAMCHLLGFDLILPKLMRLTDHFKPASMDKSQAGSLHKNKENQVRVEFFNNQPGKPKVAFQGSSEDCRDNDGVLLFDGGTFRLERLDHSVKSLSLQQTAAGAMTTTTPASASLARFPPVGKVLKFNQ